MKTAEARSNNQQMKTAEEWSGDISIPPIGLELASAEFRDRAIEIIKRIQLESWRQGMADAYQIAIELNDGHDWPVSRKIRDKYQTKTTP